MDRAYSILHVKSVEDGDRVIRGIATTPAPDRVNDIVEPLGVLFKNPLPLLWQHKSDKPIGTVKFERPTKDGIAFEARLANVTEPGALKDRVDEAWQSVKHGLVRAVSIGFRAIELAFIEATGGVRFIKSEVFELSLVTIPANAEATITSIKSIDTGVRAALGIKDIGSARPVTPGASGHLSKTPSPKEGKMTTSAQISALESQRTEKAIRFQAIQEAAAGRKKTEQERTEFDALRDELKEIDAEIRDLRDVESLTIAPTATAVSKAAAAAPTVPAVPKKKLDPGILFTQMAKVKINSKLSMVPAPVVAAKMYGQDSDVFGIVKAGEVLPGTGASGNWAYDLISQEGAAAADFVDWLRPQMITGRFGQGGVPAFAPIGFYEPYVIQTNGGVGGWVGEAKPKPATAFDFDRSTLTPLKMAAITVLSDRNIRYSSPASDVAVRNELARMLIELEDTTFIDPGNSGTSNVKPASITNGVEAIASTGADLEDVDLDIRSAMARFTAAKNSLSSGVWIMSPDNAIALSLMRNSLGMLAFGGINKDGGSFMNLPVITSTSAGTYVTLVNAADVYYADEGGVQVDASRETAIEMKDQANLAQDGSAATGASLVSMFQNNLVALRAEKTVNWKRRRTVSVSYISGVVWGGAVHIS